MSHYRITVPDRIRPRLEQIAASHDCWYGDRPSIPELVTRWADGKLPHQSKADVELLSFYEKLVLAIAQGVSANEALSELPPSGFAQKVMERANAIIGEETNDTAFAD